MARGAITVKIDGQYDDKDINRAIRDLQSLRTQSGAVAGPMQNLGKAALAAGAAFASMATVRAVADYLRDAAQAAMEDEQSVVALSTAMSNLGLAHKRSGIEDFISKMQMATGVADSELRKAYQTLVTATGDAADAQDLLGTAMDASAATGKDLQSITLAIAKASQGQVSALKRLGIPLDENTVKTKDFAAAVKTMNDRFGGQAAAAANTYAGRLKRIQEAAGEAQETIGYELLRSLDDVSEAFGGTGGIIDAITQAGDRVADLVAGIGDVVSALSDLDAATKGSADEMGWLESGWNGFVTATMNFPIIAPTAKALEWLADAGKTSREEFDRQQAAIDAASSRYSALAAEIDPAKAALLGIGDAAEETTENLEKVKTAADFLKESLAGFTTRDQFITALRDMGKAAEEAGGKLLGTRAKSIDLRGEFASAATSLLEYAQANGTNATEVYNIWDRGVKKIRRTLIDNKVDPALVDQFINKNLWMTKFTLLADAIGKGRAAEAMRLSGLALGKNAWQGMVDALNAGQDDVRTAAVNLAAAANAGAADALEEKSPSRTMYRIGAYATQGLADGITDGAGSVASAAASVASTAATAAREVIQGQLGQWTTIVDQALGAIRSYAEGVQSNVLGNIDWGAALTPDGSIDPAATVDQWLASIVDGQGVVMGIADLLQYNLPPAVRDALLAMSPQQAQEMANFLANNPWLIEDLGNAYTQLANMSYGMLGIPMGQTWATIGGESAMAMIDKAMEYIADNAKEFRRWVRSNLNTSITVTVDYVVGQMPSYGGQRANGGPVSAGRTYLVGERGPELLTMGAGGGFVTSNDDLRSASGKGGNTYSINVQAGVGDPRQIGQQVVEYIKRYESANGKVFQAA